MFFFFFFFFTVSLQLVHTLAEIFFLFHHQQGEENCCRLCVYLFGATIDRLHPLSSHQTIFVILSSKRQRHCMWISFFIFVYFYILHYLISTGDAMTAPSSQYYRLIVRCISSYKKIHICWHWMCFCGLITFSHERISFSRHLPSISMITTYPVLAPSRR